MKQYFLFLILLALFSCTQQEETDYQLPNQKPKLIKAHGNIVPKDSIAAPKVIKIDKRQLKVVKAGKPKVVAANTNIHKAGKPKIVNAGKPRIIKIGSDTFPLPKKVKAIGKVVPCKMPKPVKAALPVKKDNASCNIQYLDVDQGMNSSYVNCILHDKTGNLWFGTDVGVSKYDGASFIHFTEKEGLSNNTVLSIIEDKKGNLWFGTDLGVSKYDGASFTHFTEEGGLSKNPVPSILEDKNGNLWFGTYGGGVSKYEPSLKEGQVGTFTHFTDKEGLSNNIVWSMIEDKKGNLWFGTPGGVSKYEPSLKEGQVGIFTHFTEKEGLSNNAVWSIIEDKTGNLWFGTDVGVSKYEPSLQEGQVGTFTHFTEKEGLSNNVVSSILEDKNGNLWFGTPGGVSKYDGDHVVAVNTDKNIQKVSKSFTHFTEKEGLSNNNVTCIIEDKTGNLWFGTYGGVSKYDGGFYTTFSTAQGLANNTVFSITEDKTGNLWFGTWGGGVSKYDGKSFTNFTTQQGLANNVVRSITEDKTGNLWFGTAGGGVSKYDPSPSLRTGSKSFTNFTTAQGLAYNDVISITEDKMGNLWFGTWGGGVSKYDGNRVEEIEAKIKRGETVSERDQQGLKKENGKLVKSFTNFTTQQGLANNVVFSITEDKTGNIWFGTAGGGVSKYDPSASLKTGSKSFTSFTTAQGLANNTVLSITEDKTGNLWFGTAGGLSLLNEDGKKKLQDKVNSTDNSSGSIFKTFTTKDGLTDNFVSHVLQLPDGRMAVRTDYLGITLFKISEDLATLNNIEVYNSTTGYPVKGLPRGQKNCMLLDNKGMIWSGTGSEKTALVRFDYAALHKHTEPPVLAIQWVKVNEENVNWYNLQTKGVRKNQADIASALVQEFFAHGKTLSASKNDSIQKRFGNIEFDGITKFYPLPKNLVLPYEHNQITFEFAAIETDRPFLVKYQYMLEGYDEDWSSITSRSNANFGNINEGKYTFKLKAQGANGVWSKPISYTFKVLPPWYRTWWAYVVYVIGAIVVVYLITQISVRRLKQAKVNLEAIVVNRTAEVVAEKEEVEKQKKIVDVKQKQIVDSINYAKRIQESILIPEQSIQQHLPNSFVLFIPRDIVSGDFYWFHQHGHQSIVVCADCTGHGVPGAFLSMVGSTLLNEIVIQKQITDPANIMKLLAAGVSDTLKHKEKDEIDTDGMDISICTFKNKEVHFAAANNPVYVVNQNGLMEIEPQVNSINGIFEMNTDEKIESIRLSPEEGSMVYLSTDGFADQPGQKTNKKLYAAGFEKLLTQIHQLPLIEQKEKLAAFFIEWKGNLKQHDDILVMGVRV